MLVRHGRNAQETGSGSGLRGRDPAVRTHDALAVEAPADGERHVALGNDARDVSEVALVHDSLAEVDWKNLRRFCNNKKNLLRRMRENY